MSKEWFHTKRIIVRNFDEKLIKEIIEYRNDLDWMRYQGFKGFSYEEYCNAILALSDINEGLQLALTNREGTLIGDIYLRADGDELRFGYTINKRFSRLGLTFEACIGLFEWAKKNGYKRLVAGVDPSNMASINLLNKLNMSLVKVNGDEYIFNYNF